jgi:pimeloyl-ACP methyl ester carboxylesterase
MSTVHTIPRRNHPKPTLVCLHSSGSSGRQWEACAEPLRAAFRVETPDLLGYSGTSQWPSGKPASLDDEAQALAPLLNAAPVHLFGHSYGAAVALQIALRWPERVRSLTLYEPVRFALLLGDAATQAAGESIVAVGRRIGLEVLSGALPAAAARFVDYWSGDGSWNRLKADRQQAIAARMTKVQAEFEALFADRVPAAAYRRLAVPVRLIGGSRSPLPARQVLDVLAAQLPDATRVTLSGIGHMGPMEAPQRLLEATGLLPCEHATAQAA